MTEFRVKSPRMLIEVALPLDAINAASVREGYIYRGNPSALHKWWAQRPMAAARAVIFAQLVCDPEDLWRVKHPDKEPNAQVRGHWTKARERLFRIIEDLVKWENTNNERVLDEARDEIRKSWKEVCKLNHDHPKASALFNPEQLPSLYDPFAGGGTIPLEAQRLSIDALASDLNPVAVLINKAMIAIPPRFAGHPPVNPGSREEKTLIEREWNGTEGLADDIRYYGKWIQDETIKRIGHFYPPVQITKEVIEERPDLAPYRDEKLNVIAWLWARTVKSPNPAFSHVHVPLASTFILCSKAGQEAYVEPVIHSDGYTFVVKLGKPPKAAKSGTKAARGANFRCLMSQAAIDGDYIKAEAAAGRMGSTLIAIAVVGSHGRTYLSPTTQHSEVARSATLREEGSGIEVPIAEDPRPMTCLLYGMKRFDQLFLPRQLVALTTISDLIKSVIPTIVKDGIRADLQDDEEGIEYGGKGARAYAEAVATYLAFMVDKTAEYNCGLVPWNAKENRPKSLFTRQAIPILWDFVEVNPLGNIGGTFEAAVEIVAGALTGLNASGPVGVAEQESALTPRSFDLPPFVSTDPPYYDNIGYADLADFFYVWLRRTLRDVYPAMLSTIVTPKAEELVATAFRHGGKKEAEAFFLEGMKKAMRILANEAHPAAPITIYYAFKQSTTSAAEGTSSTGWITFLEAVLDSGLAITGTWPIRTERAGRMRDTASNALASSIVLVCRPRGVDAPDISRRQFVQKLNATLPGAMDAMTRENEGLHSPVAPVDLSQAIIGPGMGVFSEYRAVLEADGTAMTVKTALQLINRFLAEDDFDADTQFCLHWFEQYGWHTGKFGEADTLSRAKGTSVDGVKLSGVLYSAAGQVRLLNWAEYPSEWDPRTDQRLPIWEVLHQLIRALKVGGESAAGRLLSEGNIQSRAEAARQLAYRLYTLCERNGWAEDARAYNELITSWSGIETATPRTEQKELF